MKKILSKKKLVCFMLLMGVFLGWILYNSYSLPKTKVDKEPIQRMFPNIEGISECYWKAEKINKYSIPIGPTAYWMSGYIVADKNWIDKIKKEYKWVDLNPAFSPLFKEKRLNMKNSHWKYSKDLTLDVKGSVIFCNFYLDFENDILYFDMQE